MLEPTADSLENQLALSIGSDLSDVVEDLADVGFDAVIGQNALSQIPVIGAIVAVIKAGCTVRDYLFMKKVYRFLFTLKDVPIDDRQKYLAELDRDPKKKALFTENLLLLLEQADNVEKAKLMGYVARAHIEEKISTEVFLRLSAVVNRAFLDELVHLKSAAVRHKDSGRQQHLASLGLLVQQQGDPSSPFECDSVTHVPVLQYRLTSLAREFIQIVPGPWGELRDQDDE